MELLGGEHPPSKENFKAVSGKPGREQSVYISERLNDSTTGQPAHFKSEGYVFLHG